MKHFYIAAPLPDLPVREGDQMAVGCVADAEKLDEFPHLYLGYEDDEGVFHPTDAAFYPGKIPQMPELQLLEGATIGAPFFRAPVLVEGGKRMAGLVNPTLVAIAYASSRKDDESMIVLPDGLTFTLGMSWDDLEPKLWTADDEDDATATT